MKLCKKCNINKSLNEFFKDVKMKDKYKSFCKNCYNEDPSRSSKYRKNFELNRKYGIDINKFTELFNNQNNKCKLCESEIPRGTRKKWCVDHCHKTGKIRGIICNNCNLGLGVFDDNINYLNKAIEYLQK